MFCVGGSQIEVTCRVLLLDDTELTVDVKPSSRGQALLDEVFHHFNLVERDYFGIRYLDDINQTQWLDVTKSLKSQVKSSTGPPFTVYFGVRFYPADPCKLREEITRYQFFLQVKKDILQGRLPIAFDQGAELAALSIQSELGDYDPRRHSPGYASEFRFIPNQTNSFEDRVAKLHRQLGGIVPAVAEYNYLDKVKWLDMYGVDLHPVLGEAGVEYFLGLTPTGIVVYKNKSKVGNYFWPRIVRVNFKTRTFTIRVRDKNGDENTYAFEVANKPACKHLWKCTVEHHAFFRLNHVSDLSSSTSKLFSLGSKYRYSGRTEKQAIDEPGQRAEPRVERTPSKRHQRRSYESLVDADNLRSQDESRPSSVYYDRKDIAIMKVITPESVSVGHKYYDQSPKSTRSAPWEMDHNSANVRGLFTTGSVSPVSFRSEKMKFPDQPRRAISSGSESEVKRRNHRGRKASESDKDSEKNKRHRRRKDRSDSNISEGSSKHSRHRKRSSRHQPEGTTNSSTAGRQHWVDGQNKENGLAPGNQDGGKKETKHKNGSSKSLNSNGSGKGLRRRRQRSKSPKHKPPEELKQYFQLGLVDPTPLSDNQKKDIPYLTVQTNEHFKMKSPYSKHRRKSPHRYSQGDDELKWIPPKDLNDNNELVARAPPPDVIEATGRHDEVPDSDESFVTAVGSTTAKFEAQTAPIVKTKVLSNSSRGDVRSDQESGNFLRHPASTQSTSVLQRPSSMPQSSSSSSLQKANLPSSKPHNLPLNAPYRQLQHFSNMSYQHQSSTGPGSINSVPKEIQIDGPGALIPIDGPASVPRDNPPPYSAYPQYVPARTPGRSPNTPPNSVYSAHSAHSGHSSGYSGQYNRPDHARYAPGQGQGQIPPGMAPMYPATSYHHNQQNPRLQPYQQNTSVHQPAVRTSPPKYSSPAQYNNVQTIHQHKNSYNINNRSTPFYEGPEVDTIWPDAASSPVSPQSRAVKPGYYRDSVSPESRQATHHGQPRSYTSHSPQYQQQRSVNSMGTRIASNYREDRSTEL